MEPSEFLGQYRHLGGLDFGRTADDHIVIVDTLGKVVLNQPLPHTDEAWKAFTKAIEPLRPVAIAIETSNGPAVERLMSLGVDIYPMNPKAAGRLRDRKAPSGVKDDPLDAWSFADGLRTDGHDWRKLKTEDELTKQLRLLCRDQMALIEQQTALVNQLQAAVTEYYPTALECMDDWTKRASWVFIIQFPTPADLTRKGKKAWLGFLHRNRLWRQATAQQKLDQFAGAKDAFAPTQAVVQAKSLLAVCLAKQLICIHAQIEHYQTCIDELFKKHPDHDLFGSLPIPDGRTKPRLLAEIGSDPLRFGDADGLRAYAGTAPVTQKSGTHKQIHLRRMCSKPLRFAVHWLAELSRAKCTWAQAYYQAKRDQGHSHQAALRCLGNRWLKIIWKMLQTRQKYDPELHLRNMTRHGSWVVQLIGHPVPQTT
jgi:transposase